LAEADLLCVSPYQADEFWPYAAPVLKLATDRCGEWSVAQLKSEINKGALLWIIWDGEALKAACVTRLVEIKGEKMCQVLACAGSNEDWRTRFEEIEDYARNEGCVKAQIQGRKGWQRIFSDYDLAWVTLRTRLDS
jgi:hypothetical protein